MMTGVPVASVIMLGTEEGSRPWFLERADACAAFAPWVKAWAMMTEATATMPKNFFIVILLLPSERAGLMASNRITANCAADAPDLGVTDAADLFRIALACADLQRSHLRVLRLKDVAAMRNVKKPAFNLVSTSRW